MTNAPPTTFNLTEEEKAILRRTLYVIVLEPDRIEFVVKTRPRLPLWAAANVLFTSVFAVLSASFLYDAGIAILDLLPFYSTLVISSFFLNWLAFSRYALRPIRSVCLFAGSSWAICRRRRAPSYERLVEIDPIKTRVDDEIRFDPRPRIRTDVRILALKLRRFGEREMKMCREALAKLTEQCVPFPDPSPVVRRFGDADQVPWDLPRPLYRALIDHPWLVSVAPDELAMKIGPSQGVVSVIQALGGIGDFGLFLWLGIGADVSFAEAAFPWRQSVVAVFVLLLSRLLLPLITPRTVRLKRAERLVVIERNDGNEQFPAEECDARYRWKAVATDVDAFFVLSFTLYKKAIPKQAKIQKPAKIATWYLELDVVDRKNKVVDVTSALRYYLNLPMID